MSSQNKPRGRPFLPGNAGRPRGSKNKTTQIVDQFAEGQAEQVVQKVFELANGGDVACLRMLLDRISPVRKGMPINIDLPPIKTSRDVLGAVASVWTAIGDGRLTPDEANALSTVVASSIQVIQLHEVLNCIDAFEQKARPPK